MNKCDYIVIIPARGGSKSIKNKNLQKINGKSLIQISIEKFKNFSSISNIIVTSDDDKILKEAIKNGAVPWKRPKAISGDTATSESALKDVIENCQFINKEDDIIFHQCTSPLLSRNSIKKALLKFESSNCSCVFTVQEEYNPIWNTTQKKVKILNKNELKRKGRQERKPLLIETGGLYVINRQNFIKNLNRFGKNPLALNITKIESVDIDDKIDLLIATKLYNL